MCTLAGVSSRAWTRVPTYSNEVWVGDEVVVRINANNDERRLAREGKLAAHVPAEAKYPPLIAWGADHEIEWTITKRIEGVSLGHAWPRMTHAQRERAVHELASALAALHATSTGSIEGDLGVDEIGRDVSLASHVRSKDIIAFDVKPPHTLPLHRAIELVSALRSRVDTEHIVAGTPSREARALLDGAERVLRDKGSAFESMHSELQRTRVSAVGNFGLVHGDPHFENVLWDGEHVSALLDLEWARMSWIHVDVEILLAVAESPAEFASPDREHEVDPAHYADIPRWLAAAQPSWFAHPRLLDRLEWLHVSRALGLIDDGFDHPLAWARLREAIET